MGDGDLDIMVVPGWISHCDVNWELAECARFRERLCEFGRVVVFDKRGTGLSDRVPHPPALEEHVDDMAAVLDVVGSERAAVAGWTDGAAAALLFAATYPERVSALVLGAVVAQGRADLAAETQAVDPATVDQLAALIESSWGQGLFLSMVAPSMADDPRFVAWWRRLERSAVTPNAAGAFFRSMLQLDVRAVLPTVRVPTLVLHRRESQLVSTEGARWFASQIPDARYIELDGADALPYVGDADAVLDQIEAFLTGTTGATVAQRVLATVLFADIVGSTPLAETLGDRRWQDLLDEYYRHVRRLLDRFRGQEIQTSGDGFIATFDGPARAIRCALAVNEVATSLGFEVRCGLHTGEVELRGGSISGLAVHIGARVGALAEAGEVLVTGTVKDLVIGSGLGFTDRGRHELKGVTGHWQLFRADAHG
ncbi:MAG: adenylate/guanylate cyclase domain-containing protein [Actinomycetota bacterium]|nr:adenylate/guanylate cyclase domain-containing protein [Actinomycetota bacterium]